MTNKEAIEVMQVAIAEVEWEHPMKYMKYTVAFEKAIGALKKQMPIKPIFDKEIAKIHGREFEIVDVRCPYCNKLQYTIVDGSELNKKKHFCCDNCGQRLDWSETI